MVLLRIGNVHYVADSLVYFHRPHSLVYIYILSLNDVCLAHKHSFLKSSKTNVKIKITRLEKEMAFHVDVYAQRVPRENFYPG